MSSSTLSFKQSTQLNRTNTFLTEF